jgi:acyl phosphate:glycerol-3-phosphate acyltransferase
MLNSSFFDIVNFWNLIIAGIVAYLLGSIPTSVWIGRAFYGKDVRDYGSKNAGATNTYRVLGRGPALAVLLIDVLKGFLAVEFVTYIYDFESLNHFETSLMIISGMMAVAGHVYPIFAGFKGGKGVATALGMVLSMNPEIALCSFAVFLLIFLPTGYVSLGSMLAALSFPLFMVFRLFGPESTTLIAFGFLMFAFEVFTHRANVRRLIAGTESKILFRNRKSQSS